MISPQKRSTGFVLKRLDPSHPAFADLVEESRREGFWMLVRLADGWAQGRNRFARRGETLLAAWRGDELAGVCGLNVDPYVERRREARVRHLYVRPAYRRDGVGRLLVDAIVEKARSYFPVLNVRAPPEAFAFYEALGFRRFESESATHRLDLVRPPRARKGR
jgi:GNAT superfamily N-acetyltransferase